MDDLPFYSTDYKKTREYAGVDCTMVLGGVPLYESIYTPTCNGGPIWLSGYCARQCESPGELL